MSSGVDVSPHVDQVTRLLILGAVLLGAFFLFRPELWRRMFLDRVDPRPAALLRICFGLAVLWTLIDLVPLARLLFTDEGLWLTEMARSMYGDELRRLYDAERGFEHWWSFIGALGGRFTILHLRSDPPFALTIFGLTLAANVLMILGLWTRWTTLATWLLVVQLYGYTRIFFSGADVAILAFLFLCIFTRCGEAYSIDGWRRRRRAILGGTRTIPALRRIPAWPLRLMMLQLTLIYFASGLLKNGDAWWDGSALYYALNLDHFSRFHQTGVVAFLQEAGLLPLATWATRWWEALFPLALAGVAINAYERERADGSWIRAPRWRKLLSWSCLAGVWAVIAYAAGVGALYYVRPEAFPLRVGRGQIVPLVTTALAALPLLVIPAYVAARRLLPRVFDFARRWLAGKRTWLTFGLAMHIGIEIGLNVGTFSEVMVATYLAWLSGREVDAFWRYLFSRPCRPGEASRPARDRTWKRRLLAPLDRLLHRAPGKTYLICHHPDEASIRRAALLRPWDLGNRLRFIARREVPKGALRLEVEGGETLTRREAGAALTALFPGLWWLWPARLVPGLAGPSGGLANRILGQR